MGSVHGVSEARYDLAFGSDVFFIIDIRQIDVFGSEQLGGFPLCIELHVQRTASAAEQSRTQSGRLMG